MNTYTFLRTDRMRFREFTPDDISFIFGLDSDADVMRFIRPPSTTQEDAVATYLKIMDTRRRDIRFGNWVAQLHGSTEPIGWFCLKHLDQTPTIEVGYRLHKKYWGQGLATEGTKALLDYGFNSCHLETIAGVTHPENFASQRVLEKCGLQFERMAHYYNVPVKYFAIHRKEQ